MPEKTKMILEELKEEKRKNFKERIWFIKYWANYIKTHPDEEWSKHQKRLIDAQFSDPEKK